MSTGRPWYARRFDATYLEVYAYRDQAEAEAATQHLLAPLGLAGRRVLDLACGAGRYTRALTERGARPVGLDLSPELLAEARRATAGLAGILGFVRADMRWLPFVSGCFDLVVSMFTSFGYFESEADDRGMLREVARVLAPGGEFLLDFLNAERVRREALPETRRRSGRFEVHERRWLDAEQGSVVKEIELSANGERHRYREEVRLWSAQALAAALADAGFEILALHGDYEGHPFDARRSDRLIVQARRRGDVAP